MPPGYSSSRRCDKCNEPTGQRGAFKISKMVSQYRRADFFICWACIVRHYNRYAGEFPSASVENVARDAGPAPGSR